MILLLRQERDKKMMVEEKRLTKVKEEVATEDDKLKKVHISQGPAWYLIILLGFCKWFQRSIFPRTCFLSDLFCFSKCLLALFVSQRPICNN